MAQKLSKEFLLTAACSMWPPSNNRIEAIRNAANGPLDWDRFLHLAMRHDVMGLVHDGLRRAQIAVPSRIAQAIRIEAEAALRQTLALTAEAARLQSLFAEAKVPIMFIKGITLAILAYGRLGMRNSMDVDFLVPPESLSKAIAIVEGAGYIRCNPPASISNSQLRMLTATRKDLGYFHAEKKLMIELHWRLLRNRHFLIETSIPGSPRFVPITKNIKLLTLDRDELFTYLCAHGAIHLWHQLKWLADIGALLADTSPVRLEQLYEEAKSKGAGRAAAQAILLCNRLLGTRVPSELITRLQRRLTVRWLEAIALKAVAAGNSEIEPDETVYGTIWGGLSILLLRHNLRFWLFELRTHLTSQTDVLTISLPQQLQFLYPVLRLPLWLWRRGIHGRGRR
jgi:hypothetical protein